MTESPEFALRSNTSLGHCPNCAVPIPAELLLIEYERVHGPACYAECPACRDVVRPRGRPMGKV